VIDPASNTLIGAPIDVEHAPTGIAIAPDGSRAYVARNIPGVAVIDTATDEVVGNPIPVGNGPMGVTVAPDQPPLASLAPASGSIGQPIRLDASASRDPDGQIARYDWSFGDGKSAADAGPTPSHTYSAPGTYRATVTLTDSEGCSTAFVFTGITAFCNGSALASATTTVQVAAPPGNAGPTPPAPSPSDAFKLGRLHRAKRRGIARLAVWAPGPGTVLLRGKGVRTVERAATGARRLTLLVRLKRGAIAVLKRRGRLRVRVRVTFSPDAGAPETLARSLTLTSQ